MSHTAFFYGTLMAPPVLRRVIWGSQTPPTPAHVSLLHIKPAILHAHQRRKVKNADYPAILPTKEKDGHSVRGTLVTGLTDGDIWRLDIFEGSEYARRKVRVRVLQEAKKAGDAQEGEVVEAETYIWTAGAKRLEAEEWDFDEFVREKMGRWVGREGVEADEGFKGRASINDVDEAVAKRDDPTGGRGADGSISRQLEGGGKEKEEEKVEEEVLESAV